MEQQSLEQQQLVIRLWRDPVGVSELIFQTWQVLCQNRVVEIKVQYFLEKNMWPCARGTRSELVCPCYDSVARYYISLLPGFGNPNINKEILSLGAQIHLPEPFVLYIYDVSLDVWDVCQNLRK